MRNPLQEAIQDAAPEHVAELLSVFGKNRAGQAITTLPELLEEFEHLRTFKKNRTAVEEGQEKARRETAQRKMIVEDLAKVGVVIEESDARVTAALRLTEEERVDYFKSMLPPPKGSSGGGETSRKTLEEGINGNGGKTLPDADKKELASLFPETISK